MATTASEKLSLCEPGEGIFETHVTWNDIEQSMQSSLNTKAVFGPNKTGKDVGAGSGFMSKVCCIHPDWQNVGTGEQLPEMFVAKLCTCYATLSVLKNAMEQNVGDKEYLQASIEHFRDVEKLVPMYHNSECNVYLLFKKYGIAEKVRVAKFYHARRFTNEDTAKGHIIMEYLENLHPVHIIDNLPIDAVKQVLKSLAVMEATSIRFTAEERDSFPCQPFEQMYRHWVKHDPNDIFIKLFRTIDDGRLENLITRLEPCIEHIKKHEKYDLLHEKLGIRKVLCHGDLWSTNTLWRKSNEQYDLAAVGDYQISHFGAPGLDFARLFITTLSGKERRENFDSLMQTFYRFLLEELKGNVAPFTLDQLKLCYEQFFPIAAYLCFPMFNPSIVEAAMKNAVEPMEMTEVKEIMLEKLSCLLEDTLHYFEKHWST